MFRVLVGQVQLTLMGLNNICSVSLLARYRDMAFWMLPLCCLSCRYVWATTFWTFSGLAKGCCRSDTLSRPSSLIISSILWACTHKIELKYFLLWKFVWNCHLNSLCFSDATGWHGSRSTLAQIMAWCCQAASHNLSQFWFKFFSNPCNAISMYICKLLLGKIAWGSFIFDIFMKSPTLRLQLNGPYFADDILMIEIHFNDTKLLHFVSDCPDFSPRGLVDREFKWFK